MAIWPDNLDAVNLFIACGTQWRTAGMAGMPTGLDYQGVEATIRIMGMKPKATWFEDLQVMERAALDVFVERFKRS